MATVVMPQAVNQLANSCRSAVKVSQIRTGCLSRSGGTAPYTSRAPISTPAAFGSNTGRFSIASHFRVRRRLSPRLAFPFGFAALLSAVTGVLRLFETLSFSFWRAALAVLAILDSLLFTAAYNGQDAHNQDTLWIGINAA